jgi:membrane protein YdbS with pleckstrin-like domain
MDEGQHLDPRAPQLWRLQALFRLVVFWLPLSAALGGALAWISSSALGLLLSATLLGVQGLLALLWPALTYERFRYALRDPDLLISRGVLFRGQTSVPYDRIQFVDTRQGPLERLFGLSRLLVYTASGAGADAVIPGLAEETAAHLRDRLSRHGGDDGV